MKTTIKLGFVPLTDSAPLIVAQQLGFFEEFGLSVELAPQNSWATLRDKLQSGILQAAQLLAPMPIASTLGLDGAKVAMKVPLILSQNGNAITLSNRLIEEVKLLNNIDTLPFPMEAELLTPIVNKGIAEGRNKLRFATVFPFSCHQYQLNDWLDKAQLLDKVELITLPPSAMAESLSGNVIDGFCVGGPWNAKAVRERTGRTVLTSYDIWQDKTEKVLAVTSEFMQENHETTLRLVSALLKACKWLEPQINRFEAARWLQHANILNEPLDVIAPSLLGSCITEEGQSPQLVPNYNRFTGRHGEAINRPLLRGQEWIVNKMIAANQIPLNAKESLLSGLHVFDSSICDEAMHQTKGEAQL